MKATATACLVRLTSQLTQDDDRRWPPSAHDTPDKPTPNPHTTPHGLNDKPFGSYRPGGAIEDEPVNKAERASGHVAQAAHIVAGQQIRAALRPGF